MIRPTAKIKSRHTCWARRSVPDVRTFGEPATHDDISSAGKFDAFVVKVDKPDGNDRNYVGIVGALNMTDNDTIEHALMIIGPTKVAKVAQENIFLCDCDMLFPAGYGRNNKNGKKSFSKSAIMKH